ncbi:MAG: FliM/FliN family flagellar motor switch protein [Polyangiales bacterium]
MNARSDLLVELQVIVGRVRLSVRDFDTLREGDAVTFEERFDIGERGP